MKGQRSKISANGLGLLVGSFYALWHAGWAALVATGTAKPLLDWVLWLHCLSFEYVVQPFEAVRAALLVSFAFVSGYAIGWVLGAGWNALRGKGHDENLIEAGSK